MIRNPPRPHDKDGNQYRDEYVSYRRELSVCHDLVSIARGVLKRPDLRFIVGSERDNIKRAATDGTTIWMPAGHPMMRIATKHELSHIYFDSDLALRLVFVKDLLAEIEAEAKREFSQITREKLISDLCFLINILDDTRVNSCWGLMYPGDGAEMTDWYQGKIGPNLAQKALLYFANGDVDHLFTYMILLCLGQEAESAKWGRFRERIERACNEVVHQTFPALLRIVRELVLDIAREMAKTSEDLVEELTKAAATQQVTKHLDDPEAGFDHKQTPQSPKTETFKKLQDLKEGEFDVYMQVEEKKATEKAESLQAARSVAVSHHRDEAEFIQQGAMAKINLVTIPKDQVVPYIRTPEDEAIIRKWRGLFYKILSSQENIADHVGYEFMPELYIYQKLSKQPLRCFKHDFTGKGFKAKVLIDMSGSMGGTFSQVEQLTFVLQAATNFPFVDVELWGFNSLSSGYVNLYRYPKGSHGLRSPKSPVEGLTPLSVAIQSVGRTLRNRHDDNYLFIITDGFPAYRMENREQPVTTKLLMNWTSDAVRELRRQRVKTYCFMIDNGNVPGVEDMNRMFGTGYWRNIKEESLYHDAMDLISKRFVSYLRTR